MQMGLGVLRPIRQSMQQRRGRVLPGKVAALADADDAAETMDGELRFRRLDERGPHRLPSRAKKKAVAYFRMPRSVDSPIPRSPAVSRWVRPLVRASRTASSSNSFVNSGCCIIEFGTVQSLGVKELRGAAADQVSAGIAGLSSVLQGLSRPIPPKLWTVPLASPPTSIRPTV
jgi:hypothetical protein